LTLAVALLAGCSGHSDSGENELESAVLKAARAYQEAHNARDWRAVCARSSHRLRDGSVGECAARHELPAPSPTRSEPSPSQKPPTYADGSTPEPAASSSPTGPERAKTGAISAGGLVQVPAVGRHPTGYGVEVTYIVTWPGQEATTTRRALRLVREDGAWRVDQHEEIQKGDLGYDSPVLTALEGQ
jgi:hypothetical protein